MKRKIFTLIWVAMLIGLSACSSAQPEAVATEPATETVVETEPAEAVAEATEEPVAASEGDPVTATDMLGRTVTLPKPAERIITLYSEPYAQILALGLIPVGSFGWPGQPLEAAYAPSGLTIDPSVQKISGGDYLPDWELIAGLEPDLVVGWGQDEAQTAEGIVPFFGMETYSETQGDTIADYEESLRALATLTGREAEAEAAIAAMQDRVAAYEKLAPGDLSALHLGTSDGQTFFAFNGASINCGMIDRIADCAIEDLGTGRYADLTIEGVLALDPDAILFTGPIFDGAETVAAARAATEAQALWPELRAVKEGRVYHLPIDTRPDSVLTIGLYLDTIAPLLYPEVFPEPLSDEQVQEILAGEAAAEATSEETAAAGDSAASVEGFPRTIIDGQGHELTFEKPPERIVCLYTRCTEVLAAIGVVPLALPSWIAAVASDSAYFPQPNDIIILAPTSDEVGFDLEELAALQPDLVLGWEELRPALEGIAPLHSVTDDMDSYQESHAEIRAFAQIFDREQAADLAIQAFLERLAAYQARAQRDRSVIDLWTNEGEITYRDGASGTCNLLKEVAECAWPDPENADVWSVTTSIEGLLQLDPDIILFDDWANNYPDNAALLAGLGQDPLWQELTAFKTGQIFKTPAQLHNLDGMGTVGASRMLDTLMPLIYPDTFPEPLTDEEVQQIVGQ